MPTDLSVLDWSSRLVVAVLLQSSPLSEGTRSIRMTSLGSQPR